jgi:hypothetical protein
MNWSEQLNADPMPWLLESDPENPGVQYSALVDLLDYPPDTPEVLEAREDLMATGPVPIILEAQNPEGYWSKPGPGYYPKYQGSVWQIIFLAQLGADPNHPQVKAGCEYILNHNPSPIGGFSYNGKNAGLIHCLQGNLCASLIDLGWFGDPRLEKAIDWLARSVTGESIAPAEERKASVRYMRSGNSSPGFPCSANDHLPCAWGAIKVMLALSKIPEEARPSSVQAAIETGVEFLFSRDPAAADYPMGYSDKPNRSWFSFGFPLGYVTDVLQNLEVLTVLGYGGDPRLASALDLLLSKQDENGRWTMEYTYNGKTWADIEQKKLPSKWVTLRALRVLKRVAEGREYARG